MVGWFGFAFLLSQGSVVGWFCFAFLSLQGSVVSWFCFAFLLLQGSVVGCANCLIARPPQTPSAALRALRSHDRKRFPHLLAGVPRRLPRPSLIFATGLVQAEMGWPG